MLVLFDQGTPVPMANSLLGHSVKADGQQGWDTLGNGELLAANAGKGDGATKCSRCSAVPRQPLDTDTRTVIRMEVENASSERKDYD